MIPTRRIARRSLLLLCLASAGWAFSFGLGGPLCALWLEQAGVSKTLIGLNTSIYYLGVALAAPVVPFFMRGRAGSLVVFGMMLDGMTVVMFPWADSLGVWYLLRFVSGVGTALSLIPMETLVNQLAPANRRARDFGLYAFSVAIGVGLGSLVGLPLYPLFPHGTFLLGGGVTLGATLLLVVEIPWHRAIDEPSAKSTATTAPPLVDGWLCFGNAWIQGFLEGGMMTFLSLYFFSLGFPAASVGTLMGGMFAGVIVAQLPLSWLADRVGRLRILLACQTVLLAGLIVVPFCAGQMTLLCWLFVMGAACGALYPLGLALLGERMPHTSLALANGWYLACNCAGSLSGPLLMGLAIDCFGQRAQFGMGAVVIVFLAGGWIYLRRRLRKRQSTQKADNVTEARKQAA